MAKGLYNDIGTTWYLCVFSDQDSQWRWFEFVYWTFDNDVEKNRDNKKTETTTTKKHWQQ